MRKPKRLTDVELLSRLLAHSDELSVEECTAFGDMSCRIDSGRVRMLSHGQREWVEDAYNRGVSDHYVENLVSSGVVPLTGARHILDDIIENRPLRPPGR